MQDAVLDITDIDAIDMAEIEDSLGFLLRLAQVNVFEEFYDRLGPLGIKPGEFTVLWVIKLNPGLRQGTIAQRLTIKPAHMTKLTARLVDRGFVSRYTPEDDRRSVRLSLTPEGEKFVEDNREAFLNLHFDEQAKLSPNEMKTLLGLLKKMTGLDRHAS